MVVVPSTLKDPSLSSGGFFVRVSLSSGDLGKKLDGVGPIMWPWAREVLDAVTLVHVTPAVFDNAGRLEPSGLRSLDAIHLAAALDLGDDLEGLITYDDGLAEAAVSNGVAVLTPR